jgi:hypothetical protein
MYTALLNPSLPGATFVSERKPKSFLLSLIVLPLLGFYLLGCGGGSGSAPSNPTPPPATPAPAISVQPANQTVSVGQAATFSVTATGSSLQYQWSKNGSTIAGATGSSYTTPATTSADAASTFLVTVSNSVSTVTSSPATLTLTARVPAAGDLRFQQVGAASTVNGYGATAISTAAQFGWYNNSIGTPLFLSPSPCTTNSPPTCSWGFQYYALPASLTSLGLSVGYGGDNLANFQADLQSPTWPKGGTAVLSPSSVLTSLDIEPAASLFAASWIQTTQGGGFDASQPTTVALASLQAAATEEGAHSRVITALSFSSGSVLYFSYGWQSDTSTIYESSIATSSFAALPTTAATLAGQGYILTAITPSGNGDSYILVGTRVQGDTIARPFMTASAGAQATAMRQQGYAIVSILVNSSGTATYLGER